jgi:hydroxymethylpyrimidine/phosphomethylpyrimidine kinase
VTTILLIGGSDSSCGAGLFADHETLHDLAADAKTIITSVTAQSNDRFFGSYDMPIDNLESQIQSVKNETFDSVKIGMLPNPDSVYLVSAFLSTLNRKKVILDPVLQSSSGANLCTTDTIAAIKEVLFPLVDLVTPNLPESKIFLDEEQGCTKDIVEIASSCMKFIPHSILLKGGHLAGAISRDVFIENGVSPVTFQREKIKGGTSVRGTGCRLATAIAYYFSLTDNLKSAVSQGIDYLQDYMGRKLRVY